MRLGALAREGQERARRVEGAVECGGRRAWRGGARRGTARAGGGGHREGEAEGLAGLMKQTMSRRWWVVLGRWALTNKDEDGVRDQETEQGLGKTDIRGTVSPGVAGKQRA